MSNNIYDILKTMRGLDSTKSTITEGKKAKPDYLDMDKDGDKKEPMKKAVKDKSKGAIAEAVARVEQQLAEKYMGFKKAAAAGKKLGEGEYNEDMLSPGQKKIAKMSPPADKIDANDLKALRAGKKKKEEGNEFSGELAKARAQGKDSFEVDGEEYPVKEGWDEMMADVKKRSGPQPSGGSGIKAGKRYGGAAQKDEPETDNETGEVAKKGRGRPKKDKFAK
jgi:hypothetical protein